MHKFSGRKIVILGAAFAGLLLGARYVLPVALPFLLGALVALAAEPAVRFGTGRLGLPRSLAAGIGVTLTLILLTGAVSLLGALAVKELGQLAGGLPDVTRTASQGLTLLQDFLIRLAGRLPENLGNVVTGTVLELFGSGSALLAQLSRRLPQMLGSVLGWLPDGALGLGTGVLAGFMISARLPRLRQVIRERLPQIWYEKYAPLLGRVRRTLGAWLKAQGKLILVTYAIVVVGFLLLGVRNGLFWAVLVALVDAVPVLGTGTVLVPWALVELLQGQTLRGVGLLAVYGVALVSRTVLEPRLVGRHLGLDPLLTLVFLYVGYRFWGILGMIFAPMIAAAAKGIAETTT